MTLKNTSAAVQALELTTSASTWTGGYTDDAYIITPMSWNSSIAAESSTNFGIQGTGTFNADFEYVLE